MTDDEFQDEFVKVLEINDLIKSSDLKTLLDYLKTKETQMKFKSPQSYKVNQEFFQSSKRYIRGLIEFHVKMVRVSRILSQVRTQFETSTERVRAGREIKPVSLIINHPEDINNGSKKEDSV